MKRTVKNLAKTAYHIPQVQDYGNIKTITNALGNDGMDDGGSADRMKKSQVS
jgi:hypothetical protein